MNRRTCRWAALSIALASLLVGHVATSAASAPVGVTDAAQSGASAVAVAQRQHQRLDATRGGRPFAANSPWNTTTAAGTQWFNHARLHQLATPVNGSTALHWWVNTQSVGIFRSTPTDPVWTFDLPRLDAALWHRVRPATTFTVHAPADLMDGGDVDHVLVLVDGDTYYEVWNALVNPITRRVTTRSVGAPWAVGSITSGPGAGSPSNDGTRASNLSWAGGLITGDDLQRGSIDHALALAITAPMLKAGATPDYRWPATAWDNGGAYGPIKIGSRIGIPAGTPRPAGLSPLGNMVFDALQRYGAFVGDFCGGPWPQFYADKRTVTEAQMKPLFAFWEYGGSSDMEKIIPLLRVADYQP